MIEEAQEALSPDEVEDNSVEIDVVDDTPEEDQGRPERTGEPYDPSDEEIEEYSEGVQKRIKKLRFEFHEERRAKEKAERENTEAFTYAQRLLEENNQIKEALQQHQEVLQKSQSERLATEVAAQRRRYKDAYESGDAEELAAAQEDLSRAVASHERISAAPPPQRLQAAPPPEQPAPQVDPKAQDWLTKNSWFGEDRTMTGYAYGLHEQLVTQEGIDPRTDAYYERIDNEMRTRFPDKFGEATSSSGNGASLGNVVAPATRGTGKGPRKISLTQTQVALAKRLGITPEQYAQQVLKDSQ
tara:strand:+ start:730 stop:1629 length:900 start_codon:yes stop_codon:yes gene_type:complete